MKKLVGALALTLANAVNVSAAPPAPPQPAPDVNVTSKDVTFAPGAIAITVQQDPKDKLLLQYTTTILGQTHTNQLACYHVANMRILLDGQSQDAKLSARDAFVEEAKKDIIDRMERADLEVNIDTSKGDVYADDLEERLINAAAEALADQIKSGTRYAHHLCFGK